jgi:hypothetical protein
MTKKRFLLNTITSPHIILENYIEKNRHNFIKLFISFIIIKVCGIFDVHYSVYVLSKF